jgi:asparagine synthase (glutamine-hydrolysing)
MCGIAGIASADPRRLPLDEEALTAMTEAIVHRGPDEAGSLLEPGVALGMRRLSIIDVAGSPQPVASEDGEVQAVFNGEIYNFAELRRELADRGHRLRTAGDGETIVHLYEELGPRFVERLRGIFAIAIWDRPRRRLVLARDRMGVKPLYVAESGDGLAFASEVKSLISGGLVEPALDPLAAELFMAWGFVPGPATLFSGVRKLAPATTLVYEDGRVAGETRYWDPSADGPVATRGFRESRDRLLDLLRGAVRREMVSDVPLGVMLSGGLDSSLLTALMAETAGERIKTFSIGFAEDAGANELPEARRVAGRIGTDHHELETSALDHPELLDRTLEHVEEPIADLSGLGFMLLSRLASETVTVALSGQGADELLGGYRKHQIAWAAGVAARVPGAPGLLSAAAGLRAPESTFSRGMRALGARDAASRMLAMSRVVQPGERALTFTPAFLRDGAEEAIVASAAGRGGGEGMSVLAETLDLDRRLALVDNMLLYFDKASMAESLEVRVPFLDQDVVAFCSSLPDAQLVRLGNRKALLKSAARGLVEDEIIDRPKRGFFHSALGTWLEVQREDLLAETLLDDRTRTRGLFRPEEVERLLGQAGGEGKKASQRLFCLFLLERWMRRWVDADAPGRRAGRPRALVA